MAKDNVNISFITTGSRYIIFKDKDTIKVLVLETEQLSKIFKLLNTFSLIQYFSSLARHMLYIILIFVIWQLCWFL